MPLSKSCHIDSVKENIDQLVKDGYGQRQAVAIAYSHYHRWCGHYLFVQGYATPEQIRLMAGGGKKQSFETRSALAPRRMIGFVSGDRPTLLVARKQKDKDKYVPGFVVKLDDKRVESVKEALGRGWRKSSIEVKWSESGMPRLATVLLPVSKKRVKSTVENLALYAENIAEFWSIEVETPDGCTVETF